MGRQLFSPINGPKLGMQYNMISSGNIGNTIELKYGAKFIYVWTILQLDGLTN